MNAFKNISLAILILVLLASFGYSAESSEKRNFRNEQDEAEIIRKSVSKARILVAAREGNLQEVRRIVESDASFVHCRNDAGLTPLHWACARDHLETARFLVENGADIEAVDNNGRTAILMNVSADVARYLVGLDAAFKKVNKYGGSVLHSAAYEGDVELLGLWIEKGVGLALQYKYGGTALLCAASRDQKEAVELLLNAGANIDAVDRKGRSVLHCAAGAWNLKIEDPNTDNLGKTVEFLLKKGMDANVKDNGGETPLHVAAQISNGRRMIAARLLIAHGANVNSQGGSGTPLYCAVGHGSNMELIRLLVENGADVSLGKLNHDTPLHIAVRGALRQRRGNYRISKYLLKRGAEVNVCLDSGGTALHSAAEMARPDLVRLLLEYGADVNARDNNFSRTVMPLVHSRSPLHRAVNAKAAARSYDDYGGDVRVIAPEKMLEVVSILLSHGADINAQNSEGETALDLALRDGTEEIVNILRKNRAVKGAAK